MTRLNVGCGKQKLDGWVNVDLDPAVEPDVVAPAWAIPLPDESVTELMAIHIWEHFARWECDDVIAEWYRLMEPKALLVLELPDLFKFCQNILEGRASRKGPDQLGLWALFGDPVDKNPLNVHKWGWTFSTLAPYLEEHGFKDCHEFSTQWHRAGMEHRDFRLEARRV